MKRAIALAALLLAAGCTTTPQDAAKSPEVRSATDTLKNALVVSAVKATLVADDPDTATTVGVTASDGAVTLRGRVRDAATRDRLVAAARKVAGVTAVVDDLRVDPNAPRLRQQVGDVALAARVQAAIAAQVGVQHVSVRVDRGVATVEGTVPDAKTKETVLATAHGTTGIRNVVDRIRVAVP